jgi:hypothetical protein
MPFISFFREKKKVKEEEKDTTEELETKEEREKEKAMDKWFSNIFFHIETSEPHDE